MKPAFSQRIISGALVLWLSGVALLFCCGNMEARAAAAEKDSCPLARTSHCDRQSSASGVNNPDFASFQRENLTPDCCGFLPKVFDRARNIEKIPQAAAPSATTVKISAPKFSAIARAKESPKTYRAVVHNRGSTYLKNCVFRI
ncbi:MAG TPA: hypothetical protein VK400_19440 [Pyrinomonadaceae bacterium]|nr:hypothetical protein [Pyrinomonadaceae bacterium]